MAQKEKAGVFVKTGKVRVESAEHEVVIQANEKAELKGSVLKTDTIRRPQDVFGVDDSVLIFEQAPITEVVKVIREKTGIQIDLAEGLEKNLITTRINSNEPDIAGELAFLCGCKCETLVKGNITGYMKSKWLLLLLWMCMVARPEAWGQEVKSANTVAEEWIQVNSSSATYCSGLNGLKKYGNRAFI